jgi:hypothetical protein
LSSGIADWTSGRLLPESWSHKDANTQWRKDAKNSNEEKRSCYEKEKSNQIDCGNDVAGIFSDRCVSAIDD